MVAPVTGAAHFRMNRLLDPVHQVDRLFMQLLAGTQAGVNNLDVFARNETGKLNHLPREFFDSHGIAHVEREDFSSPSLQRALENQPDRLRDTHKESGHFRMSDCDGTTLGNLAAEYWNHAPGGSENVAESHCGEAAGTSTALLNVL